VSAMNLVEPMPDDLNDWIYNLMMVDDPLYLLQQITINKSTPEWVSIPGGWRRRKLSGAP
jgi:hypothetical protein